MGDFFSGLFFLILLREMVIILKAVSKANDQLVKIYLLKNFILSRYVFLLFLLFLVLSFVGFTSELIWVFLYVFVFILIRSFFEITIIFFMGVIFLLLNNIWAAFCFCLFVMIYTMCVVSVKERRYVNWLR
jgi:hypothetical protein